MKIRILALHLAFGGVEKAISNMANIFVDKYEVEIICVYDMPNAPAYPLDKRVKVSYLLKDIPNRDEFRTAVQKKQPLRILQEGCKAVSILHQKKAALKKAIQSIHDGILITTRHEDTLLVNTYGDPKVGKIAQLHHDHKNDPKLLKEFEENYKNIDVFVLLSEQLQMEVEAHLKTNPMRCCTIPNFIDHIPQPCDLNKKEPVFVACGRFHEVKGFDRLLKAMELLHTECPDWKLCLIGDGEEKRKLEAYIQEHAMESYVELCGQKTSEEIEEINLNASIYVMTSHSEGLPYVLIEAQSCSLPIVAFDVRVGPRAVVEDHVSGFLVKDNDIEAFVKAAATLVKNPALWEQMAEAAYQQSYRFSKDNVRKLWFDLLTEVESRCTA